MTVIICGLIIIITISLIFEFVLIKNVLKKEEAIKNEIEESSKIICNSESGASKVDLSHGFANLKEKLENINFKKPVNIIIIISLITLVFVASAEIYYTNLESYLDKEIQGKKELLANYNAELLNTQNKIHELETEVLEAENNLCYLSNQKEALENEIFSRKVDLNKLYQYTGIDDIYRDDRGQLVLQLRPDYDNSYAVNIRYIDNDGYFIRDRVIINF